MIAFGASLPLILWQLSAAVQPTPTAEEVPAEQIPAEDVLTPAEAAERERIRALAAEQAARNQEEDAEARAARLAATEAAGSDAATGGPSGEDARWPDGSLYDWADFVDRNTMTQSPYYWRSESLFEGNRQVICPMVRDSGPETVYEWASSALPPARPMTQAALDNSFIAMDVSVLAVDRCPNSKANVRSTTGNSEPQGPSDASLAQLVEMYVWSLPPAYAVEACDQWNDSPNHFYGDFVAGFDGFAGEQESPSRAVLDESMGAVCPAIYDYYLSY